MVSTTEQNRARRVCDGYQNDAACTAMSAVRCPIVDGGTQWMVLSAAINNPAVRSMLEGTCSITASLIDADFLVIVDHEDAVGRRSRHRAGVLRHRPRGRGKRLCRQRASPCSLNRVDGRVGEQCARTAFPSKPFVTRMYQ